MTDPDVFNRFPDLNREKVGSTDLPPYVADLASSFPLLFSMLASDAGTFSRRAAVLHLVEQGKPLPEVAGAYGLPLSLRRIPPEACKGKLEWFGWSKGASAALANHVPSDPTAAARWLWMIYDAAHRCDERFALWMARQPECAGSVPLGRAAVLGLAIYAWYSLQPDNPLESITPVPWTPRFSLKRAMREANDWFSRVRMLSRAGAYPLSDSWLEAGYVNGFEIAPILSFDALETERAAMGTCLHMYIDRLASGSCRLFAVRRNGTSIATLEIAPDSDGLLAIVQLKGVRNRPASDDVRAAVQSWFASQPTSNKRQPARSDGAEKATPGAKMLTAYRDAKLRPDQLPTENIPPVEELTRHMQSCIERAGQPEQTTLDPELCERVRAMLCVRLNRDWLTDGLTELHFHHISRGILLVSAPAGSRLQWLQGRGRDVLLASAVAVWPHVFGLDVRSRRANGRRPAARPAAGGASLIDEARRSDLARTILATVAGHYKVTQAEILSQRRHQGVMLPRQVAIFLTLGLSGCSMAEAGRHFGGRDQTTVLLSVRKLEKRMETEPALRGQVEALRSALAPMTSPASP